MRREVLAWIACSCVLAIAGCTAISGLDGSFHEVDCFPSSSCDASVEGGAGDDSSGQGDVMSTPDTGRDGTALDAPAGEDVSATRDSGGPDAPPDVGGDASEDGGCPTGDLVCTGACVANDTKNCGTCGHDCTNLPQVSGSVTCSPAGICSFPLSSCATGWTHCSANPDQGCETNVTTTSNCGSCGNSCSGSTPVCTASGSTYQCASGCPASSATLCSGSCVDTTSNASDCKTCGNVCTTTLPHAQPLCLASACTFSCNVGYTSCSGACVDETSDDGNCGACGKACTGGSQCTGSACQCPGGTHLCGTSCVADNVDSCGPSCTLCAPPANATPTCDGTNCGFSCNSPYTACSGACVNENTDVDNCGGCGALCPGGDTCTAGTCLTTTKTITLVQHQPGGGTSANSVPLPPTQATFTLAQTAGDLNVVIVGWSWTAIAFSVSSVTDSIGNAYTQAGQIIATVSPSGGFAFSMWYNLSCKGAPAGNVVNVAFTYTAGTNDLLAVMAIAEWSGGVWSFDQEATLNNAAGSLTPTFPITTKASNELLFAGLFSTGPLRNITADETQMDYFGDTGYWIFDEWETTGASSSNAVHPSQSSAAPQLLGAETFGVH